MTRFTRVLLTTTVQGYEGTGRGFLLKFCARFSGLRHYALSTPIRWAAGCPLERFVANALLFDDALIDRKPEGEVRITPLAPRMWESDPARAASVYELLCAAHYRTSPLDLRRMMDAPGQHFAVAETGLILQARSGWWKRAGCHRSLAAPCGRDTGVHAGISWRSRWRRTAALRSRRR